MRSEPSQYVAIRPRFSIITSYCHFILLGRNSKTLLVEFECLRRDGQLFDLSFDLSNYMWEITHDLGGTRHTGHASPSIG